MPLNLRGFGLRHCVPGAATIIYNGTINALDDFHACRLIPLTHLRTHPLSTPQPPSIFYMKIIADR